jgi:hypothetical protein
VLWALETGPSTQQEASSHNKSAHLRTWPSGQASPLFDSSAGCYLCLDSTSVGCPGIRLGTPSGLVFSPKSMMRSRDRGPHRFKLNSGPAADAAWPCRCRQPGKLDGGGICPTSKQIPNGRQSFWKQAWVDHGTRGRKIENRVVFELVQRAGRLQQLGGPGSSTPVRGKPQLLPGHRCCPPPSSLGNPLQRNAVLDWDQLVGPGE